MSNADNKKLQFNEALSYLVETANINSGKLTLDEIHTAFNGIIEDESMYKFIYDYLLENKITIIDYIPTDTDKINLNSNDEIVTANTSGIEMTTANTSGVEMATANSAGWEMATANSVGGEEKSESLFTANEHEKEKMFVKMFLDEVSSIEKLDDEQEIELLKKVMESSEKTESDSDKKLYKSQIDSLVERNLYLVPEIADSFKSVSITKGDLLQEGNLGLVEGVYEFINCDGDNDEARTLLSDFHNHLKNSIKNAMLDAISEQDSASRLGEHIANRANSLDRESVNLTNELGRTPTLEELSKALSISEEEASEIMKMSLNALNSDGAE